MLTKNFYRLYARVIVDILTHSCTVFAKCLMLHSVTVGRIKTIEAYVDVTDVTDASDFDDLPDVNHVVWGSNKNICRLE
jgi:hypothetical protein